MCSNIGCTSGYCWCNDSTECCQTCELLNFNKLPYQSARNLIYLTDIMICVHLIVNIIIFILVTSDCPCDNRCHKIDQAIQCCNSECAAGCTGGNNDQCQVSSIE